MKSFLIVLMSVFPMVSHAAVDVVGLLSKFSSSNVNKTCSVSYKDNVLKIENNKAKTQTFVRKVNIAKDLTNGTVELSSSDYDGEATVYLIKKDGSLMVVATWLDNDGGYDESAFCLLEAK